MPVPRLTKAAKLVAMIPVALVLLVLLAAATFAINEREQVIITQFGDPVRGPITQPGLHFKLPFIQEVRRFDKRLLTWDGDVNQIPTLGREFIIVDTTARWRIVDPLLFLKSVRDVEGAQSRLDDILDSVVRDKVSSSQLEEIVRSKDFQPAPDLLENTGRDQEALVAPERGREQLQREILQVAQQSMPQYGVELVDVRIKRLNYIADVARKVEERMISERQRIAEQFRSEGQGQSAQIDGQTEKMAREITSDAQRRAETIRGEGDAEAAAIYAEAFGADAEFYAFLKTLESYKDVIGKNTTLVLPAESEFYRYLQGAGMGLGDQ